MGRGASSRTRRNRVGATAGGESGSPYKPPNASFLLCQATSSQDRPLTKHDLWRFARTVEEREFGPFSTRFVFFCKFFSYNGLYTRSTSYVMSNLEGGSSRGDTSWWDPDAPKNFIVHLSISDGFGSSQRQKKKRQTAHDWDTGYPSTEYTHFVYDVAIQWYKDKTMEYLESTYLRNITTGIVKLAETFGDLIVKSLAESTAYYNCENK